MSPKDVKQKAAQINKISEDYHLSHAVFACNRIVEDVFKRSSQEKVKKLRGALQSAEKNGDTAKIAEITTEIDRLRRPFRIYVEYVHDMDINGGRVIKLPTSNQFVISLPGELLRQSRNEDGSYNPRGVKTLRQRMAHELGHIALHVEELLDIDGTQGSRLLSDDAEEEANIFSTELLLLRHERNAKLFNSGLYKEAF